MHFDFYLYWRLLNKHQQNNNHVNESILSEQILEDQKKNRTNHMEYLPGMENIGSEIMDKVVSEINNYDYDKYTEYDAWLEKQKEKSIH